MVLNIKRVREEKGMTQEQLAEKANVNRSLLNQLETGKLKNTSINTLQKIADTLNCKINMFRKLNLVQKGEQNGKNKNKAYVTVSSN